MKEFLDLWLLMRMPMQRWWWGVGRWLVLPVLLLSLAASLHFMLMPNMPLWKWAMANRLVSVQVLDTAERLLSIPIMVLLYAFVGLWASAAIACQSSMRRLLEESAAPCFDASPLNRLLVSYGQGLVLLPVSLVIYTGLGLMHAMAERVQPSMFVNALQFNSTVSGSAGFLLRPEQYTNLVEWISQYSASAFAIGALSLWVTALAVAGGSLAGAGFLAMRSLDVAILSLVTLFGTKEIFSGRPLIREALPVGEFWWCIPLLLICLALLASARRWARGTAWAFIGLLTLSPAFFASVLPSSLFFEDTLFARVVNSMRYMYYGIGGPVFQVKASISEAGDSLRFREHLMLYTDRADMLMSSPGSGIMLAWLGNLLVLALLFLLVAGTVRLAMPRSMRSS